MPETFVLPRHCTMTRLKKAQFLNQAWLLHNAKSASRCIQTAVSIVAGASSTPFLKAADEEHLDSSSRRKLLEGLQPIKAAPLLALRMQMEPGIFSGIFDHL